ncbi:DNA ligase [Paenibacillus sp. F411]|uniref:ATP-dependent DNA ligase n=1 Tax=Paenibacillus sp. F411 TaxID=2820239 RepID=UPI001AAF3A1E|nr:DNA ligase [Paenibacillus sp. F411]MBO2943775.1 DNA ligase [Paenibacillus sp. F411]
MASGSPLFPREPMAPIAVDDIPEGEEWGYQLKWDGVRILALVEHGKVTLMSRKLLDKTALYPEITACLRSGFQQRLLLDGEVIYFDPEQGRPVFQKVLQRERSRVAAAQSPRLTYVLFDLLIEGEEDLRTLPYEQRHARLQELMAKQPGLLLSELFRDGPRLWEWAQERGWEGIVIKRLSAPYREGKKHKDWLKKKIALTVQASSPGIILREGRVASLVVLGEDDAYIGRVSLGLTEPLRRQLLSFAQQHPGPPRWSPSPAAGRKEQIQWLSLPLQLTVTFLEWSQDGMMRHPKLLHLEGLEPE